MSNYGSGMGMIFTNSGKQTGKQAPVIQAQARSFQPTMNAAGRAAGGAGAGGGAGGAGTRGFRTMDLGNLKTNKSCGSCGH